MNNNVGIRIYRICRMKGRSGFTGYKIEEYGK
jgi:hypothetical protein